MTRLPTDDRITELFGRLRRHARPAPRAGATDSDPLARLADLQVLMILALRRARTPAPAVDGYPSSTLGTGRAGASLLTSVESAAEALAFGTGAEHDQLLEDVEQAVGYLVDAVNALGALQSRLTLIERRASPLSRSEAGGAGECLACGEAVSGAAHDRLKRGLGPCCYSTWIRRGRPDLAEFRRERRSA